MNARANKVGIEGAVGGNIGSGAEALRAGFATQLFGRALNYGFQFTTIFYAARVDRRTSKTLTLCVYTLDIIVASFWGRSACSRFVRVRRILPHPKVSFLRAEE